MTFSMRALLLTFAITAVSAYGPPDGGQYGPNPGGDDDNGNNGEGPSGSNRITTYLPYLNKRAKFVVAHAVLASLAFVLLFPAGSILIRLGSFRGVWLVHGLFQLFAYVTYLAAFGVGVWMTTSYHLLELNHYHPVIGILVMVLLFFQPILGYIHHVQFKKHSRRTVWSYGHIWLGRVVVTLGMINGGLGLNLTSGAPPTIGFAASKGVVIAYSVVAAVMWLLWAAVAVFGERKRAASRKALANKEVAGSPAESSTDEAAGTPPAYKGHYAYRAYA